MTPAFAVFRHLYAKMDYLIPTYDYHPMQKIDYPFGFLAQSYVRDRRLSDMVGSITQVAHIYALTTQRQEIDQLLIELKDSLQREKNSHGYNLKLNSFNPHWMIDTTDVDPLIHVVIDVDFLYTLQRKRSD